MTEEPIEIKEITQPFASEANSENKPRKVVFGDVSVTERLEDRIPPEELRQYEEDFSLFKKLIDSADNAEDKAFLSSRLVFASVMGIEPESSFFPNEAKVLFRALEKNNSEEKFSFFIGGKYEDTVAFIHLRAAERTLRQKSKVLGISLPEKPLSNEEISKQVMELYNQPNPKMAHRAIGILSGFPTEAVNYSVESESEDALSRSQWFLRPLRTNEQAFLFSKTSVSLDRDRVDTVYTRSFIEFGETKINREATKVGIKGFGTAFRSPYPLPVGVSEYCQKLLEIDRRLGVLDYVIDLRSKMSNHP